jgi:hypothetical protein
MGKKKHDSKDIRQRHQEGGADEQGAAARRGGVVHAQELDAVRRLAGRAPASRRLSHIRVPVPPVPLREPGRSTEIQRRRRYLPPDLRVDPAFIVDSNRWHTWRQTEEDSRRHAGFLGNRDFPV